MKRLIKSLLAASLMVTAYMASSVGFSTTAQAQAMKPAVIIVIDSRRLFSESLVSKDIRSQLTQVSQTFGAEENATKEKLLKEKEDLDKQRALLPQAAYEQKYNELKNRADQLNRKVDLDQKKLNVTQVRANQALQRVLNPIIAQVADKKGATIVLEKAQIIHQAPGLDVTTEVIELLDKQLPSLKVQVPSEAEILELERQAQQGGR
ncbi:MAG: OmpH family outer membrane protein [Sphingomonadales bacterium]|nr:OmpH family outer membrane protein [Sphingomonadales bacterium]